AEVYDAATLRDSLVVWLIEQSPANEALREGLVDDMARLAERASTNQKHSIKTAVVGVGDETAVLTPEPVEKSAEIEAALGKLKADSGNAQDVFSSLAEAAEAFLPYRMQGNEVLMIVVGSS